METKQTTQESEINELMKEILSNCEKQLSRMKEALNNKDVYSFLWGQYGLWDGYHELSTKAKENKGGNQDEKGN